MTSRKPVVLFGSGRYARTIHFFLENDSPYAIAATTVDEEFVDADQAFGLPTVSFERVHDRYPPDSFDMFIALGYRQMNHVRMERYSEAKRRGYHLITHVSPRASTWQNLTVGDNSIVLDNAMIHPFVTIGSNTIIWSGSHIGHNSIVGDHCFIASRSAVSGNVRIGEYSFLGTNCTIRDGVTIAPGSAIGAGVVVTKDTTPGQVLAPPIPRILPGTSARLPRL
ncbi:MAG: transferase [Actinobacteria bacterium]|nr:MAG: transferase [Actinomycetota bacterium]